MHGGDPGLDALGPIPSFTKWSEPDSFLHKMCRRLHGRVLRLERLVERPPPKFCHPAFGCDCMEHDEQQTTASGMALHGCTEITHVFSNETVIRGGCQCGEYGPGRPFHVTVS